MLDTLMYLLELRTILDKLVKPRLGDAGVQLVMDIVGSLVAPEAPASEALLEHAGNLIVELGRMTRAYKEGEGLPTLSKNASKEEIASSGTPRNRPSRS